MEYDGFNIPPKIAASLQSFLQAQIPLWNETLQPDIYAALSVCHTLACFAVALRIYARRLKAQPLRWDDWLVVIALVRQFFKFCGLTAPLACQFVSHII